MTRSIDPSARHPDVLALGEERARALLEGIDAIVLEHELESGCATYVSPRAETVLGYPVEQWLEPGFWAERVVHPDDRSRVVVEREAALAAGRDHEMSYRALARDGRVVWLRDLARVARDAAGAPTHLRVVMIDITARKEAEEEAERVLGRHEALLRAAGEGIYGIDAEGNTTFVNRAATRILGWEPEELIGRPQHELIHHTHPDGRARPREECPIHATLRDGEAREVRDDLFWRRDGSCIAVAYSSAPVLEEGRVTGVVVTFRDVSAERRNERRLRESEEQLLEAQRIAHLGSWEWELASGAVTWSDELYRIFGLDRDADVRSFESYLARVHPDDRDAATAAIREAVRSGGSFDFENRAVRPGGELRVLRTRGRAVVGAAGRTTRLFGTCQDITDQKERAARELELAREHEARLRAEESREQVSRILESITDAFFALDGEWRFTYLNREAERLLQRPREELVGRSIWDEFPLALGSEFERNYRLAGEQRRTVQFEAFYPPPLDAWYEVRAYPTGDAGLSVYFRDINEQKRARDALRRSEHRFRSLVEASAAIVWTTNAAGEFEEDQPEWSAFTGQSWEEARGRGWIDPVHPDDRERTLREWDEALQTKSMYSIEHRIRRHDGEYRHMQARAVPLLNDEGEVDEWVGVHADVTPQRRAEEERERAVAARARFYATMSHELRTPINAVLGYTDLILAGAYGEYNEKQGMGIERTHRAAHHLLELVNDVLDLSKLEAGKLEVELEAVEIPALIDDLFATVRPLAVDRGSELKLTCPDPVPAIQTDPRRVRQILLNLLSNAIKFGRGGRVEVVCAPLPDGGASVEVIDEGEGIAPENLPRIFEEFVQVGEEQGGTGLGLPISKRLAELLGGRLEVESTPGVGSTFRLRLPHRSRAAGE